MTIITLDYSLFSWNEKKKQFRAKRVVLEKYGMDVFYRQLNIKGKNHIVTFNYQRKVRNSRVYTTIDPNATGVTIVIT